MVTRNSFRSVILTLHPGYHPARLHTAETARIVPLAVGAVIAVGLWLWMAWANGKGLAWARTVAAGLFGINTLDLLFSLMVVRAPADMVAGVVIWLAGLAATVLLFSPDPVRSTDLAEPDPGRPGRTRWPGRSVPA